MQNKASIIALIAAFIGFTFAGSSAAQSPTAEDLRRQLEAAGMSAADIDAALASMEEITGSMAMPPQGSSAPFSALGSQSAKPCAEGQEDCAIDADDPKVVACRQRYSNIITKTARDNFGDRLGRNALRIAQTCSAAAAGGTLEYRRPAQTYWTEGGWHHNRHQLFEIGNYWQRIMNFNFHLAHPEDVNLDHSDFEPDSPRYNEIIASFPLDLQTLITEDEGSTESYRQRSLPIHERCEFIRAEVADRFKANVSDGEICLIPPAPDPAPKREEGE